MAKRNIRKIVQWPRGRLDFSDGCIVMGILNVTPDSFSDGGRFLTPADAIEHAIRMTSEGAAIIDVGAESTRPGAKPVSPEDQIDRAVPVIEALRKKIDVPISIDTHSHQVAAAALDAGAAIINDITALGDERMGLLAAEKEAAVVLMHMKGQPATMQIDPHYDDVVAEVLEFLLDRAKRAERFGIPPDRIFIDPGIGFGKTLDHNILLLKNVDRFVSTPYRVLIGTSRKRFLGSLTGRAGPAERIFATAATVSLAVAKGVSVVRVHDVPQMVDIVNVTTAINCRR